MGRTEKARLVEASTERRQRWRARIVVEGSLVLVGDD
jgi:hypothetical protein